jgi:hypothetical protein
MKRVIILVCIIGFSITSVSALWAEEKTELFIVHEYIHTLTDKVSNPLTSRNVRTSNYDLNLFGVGLRYFPPINNISIVLSSKSLLNRQRIGVRESFLPFPPGSLDDVFFIDTFNKVSLLINYNHFVGKRTTIIGGIGGNYIKTDIIRAGAQEERYWADYMSWCLNAGINYNLTQRLKIGCSVNYETKNTVHYSNGEASMDPFSVNLEISPVSFNTALFFSF